MDVFDSASATSTPRCGVYVDVLECKLAVRRGYDYAAVDVGGGLVIGLVPRVPGEGEGGTVGLWTSDPLDSVVGTLIERGVEFDGPIIVKEIVQLAFFCDPDGNRLSISNAPPSPTIVTTDREGGRLPLFDHLGLRWVELAPTSVTVEVDIRDDLRGPAGTLQGGGIATLVDAAAASTAAQASAGVVATSEMTIHFLAPGRVGPVRAVGELLRGRTGGAAVEVRVSDVGNSNRLVAVALIAFGNLKGSSGGEPTGD